MVVKYNYNKIEKNSINNILLSTLDIDNIMQQHNSDDFHFLPTSPIDFDTWKDGDIYVRNDIKTFHNKLKKYINKKNVGFIFNTAPHTHGGNHWVALYIDTRPRVMKIFYFDSFGEKPPIQIKKLIYRIISESKKTGGKPLTYVSTNGIRRQNSKTECGMYCVYVLINLALKKKSINYFIDKSINIPNRIVYNLRSKVFIK